MLVRAGDNIQRGLNLIQRVRFLLSCYVVISDPRSFLPPPTIIAKVS